MRFTSIATGDHRPQVERLCRSLHLTHPGAPVLVHVDDPDAFAGLPNPAARVVVLPEIAAVGAKRAYLAPEEYVALRRLVRSCGVRPVVVELGAGETTGLFASCAGRTVSIEPSEGPWLDRARARGAEVHHVPFDHPDGFDPGGLDAALADVPEIDLLFVDSPVGGQRRAFALRQVLARHRPRRILFHDARRDALLLLAELQDRGYIVDHVHPSARGFVMVALPGTAPLRPVAPGEPPLTVFAADLAVLAGTVEVVAGEPGQAVVSVRNPGDRETWRAIGDHPVQVAFHVFQDGVGRHHDGVRTALPCDLEPGDALTFPVTIDTVDLEAGSYELEVCLVEEGRAWFEQAEPSSATRCPLTISASSSPSSPCRT